jgi:CRISPR-associated endoribonuclease Cas6
MRFKITFKLDETPQLLPLNYKYPTSAWIYKVIQASDNLFSEMLHNNGFRTEGGKNFKLFCFSDFAVPKGKWQIEADRMKIWAETISLTVTFMLPAQMQHFFVGLFKGQEVSIGDEKSQLKMTVQSIEAVQLAIPESTHCRFKWLSPIFLRLKTDAHASTEYISPQHPMYSNIFITNLIDKYRLYCAHISQQAIDIEPSQISFTCLHPEPRSIKQTIKASKKEQTDIRAFKFDFTLAAPRELIEIGLSAGFGAANSQGFGCCELVPTNNRAK